MLLIRVADPEGKTAARQAYVEKQPFYEPFMGGGLVTAFALPVTAALGGWACLGIVSVILLGWFAYAAKLIHSRSEQKEAGSGGR